MRARQVLIGFSTQLYFVIACELLPVTNKSLHLLLLSPQIRIAKHKKKKAVKKPSKCSTNFRYLISPAKEHLIPSGIFSRLFTDKTKLFYRTSPPNLLPLSLSLLLFLSLSLFYLSFLLSFFYSISPLTATHCSLSSVSRSLFQFDFSFIFILSLSLPPSVCISFFLFLTFPF